jgi:hypothetical protein
MDPLAQARESPATDCPQNIPVAGLNLFQISASRRRSMRTVYRLRGELFPPHLVNFNDCG